MWRRQDQPKSSPAGPESAAKQAVDPGLIASSAPETPARTPVTVLPGSRLTGSLRVKGEITGTEDLLIDAKVEGLVHLVAATAHIGPNGHVVANVTATQITVEGSLEGDLQAAERVRIGATGKTRGKISARRISADDGAEIHGAVDIRGDEQPFPRPMI